ncbi:response regulator [Portibacter lacus]|uniref:DNA-binding response regulator n=1 Tax=Portibacter lacus TaxID=1099794 RepID=A0AA37SQ86_9BACT|nr:response regulator transcription factor [Portibacter lacus]GLR15590.1 DNA-binding response regulator [Portibacter lacus]
MIKIGIVDDHKIFRDGVTSIIEDVENMEVIWSTSNTKETIASLAQSLPDVILMDISLGSESGITLTKEILITYPEVRILALSMHFEDNYIVKILEAGAKGYILKDSGSEEMLRAINTVNNGNTYYSNHVSSVLIKHITQGTKPTGRSLEVPLTKRELEVLKLIAEEYSNPEIAEKLYISIRTVDTHRRNLLDKLDVKNTAGLVKYAMKIGITE